MERDALITLQSAWLVITGQSWALRYLFMSSFLSSFPTPFSLPAPLHSIVSNVYRVFSGCGLEKCV